MSDSGIDDIERDLLAETRLRSAHALLIEQRRANAHAIAAGAPVMDFEETTCD